MTDEGNHRGDGIGDGGRVSPLPTRQPDRPAPDRGGVDWQAYFSPGGSDRPDDRSEWRDLLDAVRRHKLWIAAAFVFCTAAGVAAAWYFPEVYQAEAKVWIDSSLAGQSEDGGYALLNGQGWSSFFESSRVLLPAAREMQAYLDPVEPEDPEAAEALFADFSLQDDGPEPGRYRLSVGADGEYRLHRARWTLPGPLSALSGVLPGPPEDLVETGRLGEPVGTSAGFAWRPDSARLRSAAPVTFGLSEPRDAVRGIRNNLDVQYSSESGLMTLRYQAVDSERAASTLNLLLDRFTAEAEEIKEGKLARVIGNLERRVAESQERLDQARQALNRQVSGRVSVAYSQPGGAGGGGGEGEGGPLLTDAYLERRTQSRELQAELEILRDARERMQAGDQVQVGRLEAAASESWPQQLMSGLSELDSLRTQRRMLLQSFTEEHPDVRQLQQRITHVRSDLLPPLVSDAIRVLEARRQTLQQRLQGERQELEARATENIRGQELWSAYARAETLYAQQAAQLQGARLANTSQLPAFEVLDRAAAPSVPFHSRDNQLLALAALGGLALGIGGAILRDRMDDRIHEPEDLRERLGMPFLGVVPRISSPTTARTSSNEAILSAFRSVRNRIEGLGESAGGIVSVTSPGVGDGKSTVATNLAVSYANAGYRTILIDADLFRGCLHRIFGISRGPGLIDHLLDGSAPGEIVHDVDVPGLSVVPAGRPAADGANVLAGGRTDRLLSHLSAASDVVVMDTSPLTAGTEAAVLGEKSDKTALVFRAEHTDLKQAEIQLQMLYAHRVPLVGAVLNDVPRSAPYYGYYSSDEYYREIEPAASALASRQLTSDVTG